MRLESLIEVINCSICRANSASRACFNNISRSAPAAKHFAFSRAATAIRPMAIAQGHGLRHSTTL
jgi:hypothetical protein